MESIKEVLMRRDNMSEEEAASLIAEAKAEFNFFLSIDDIESAENICADWFGLEPDYIDEFF